MVHHLVDLAVGTLGEFIKVFHIFCVEVGNTPSFDFTFFNHLFHLVYGFGKGNIANPVEEVEV